MIISFVVVLLSFILRAEFVFLPLRMKPPSLNGSMEMYVLQLNDFHTVLVLANFEINK